MFVRVGTRTINLDTVRAIESPVRARHPEPKTLKDPTKPFVNDAARIHWVGTDTPEDFFDADAVALTACADGLVPKSAPDKPADKPTPATGAK